MNTNHLGRIIIISGPSGVGKGTVIKSVLESLQLPISISATTRPPRAHETHGEDYYFLSQVEFEEKVRSDSFLEWAKVHDYYYGTLKSQINAIISKGQDILLEIDVQGARIVMESDFPVLSIFLLPPTIEALKERLVKRDSDSADSIDKRVKRAEVEILDKNKYNHCVVNNTLSDAVNEVLSIIKQKN